MGEGIALYEILTGFSCNCNCKFCSLDFEKRAFNKTSKEITADIIKAKGLGVEILGFTGGEPTIRKDIIGLVKFAKKSGFRTVRMQTNGMMLANKKFAEKIVGAGANYFKVSIHAHRADIQDSLTQAKGSFEKAVKGIKNIKALGRTVEANFVINRKNYVFLPQTVAFLMGLGVSQFVIIFPSYLGNAKKFSGEIGVRLSEAAPYVKEALDIIESYGLDKGVVVSIPPCFLPGYEKNALAGAGSFRTIVSGPNFEANLDSKIKSEKTKCGKCRHCLYRQECDGIRRDYAALFGFKEIKPVKGKK
ncbi:MAG: radical SAM protein [Candidatus Diapherotrites archaeon]